MQADTSMTPLFMSFQPWCRHTALAACVKIQPSTPDPLQPAIQLDHHPALQLIEDWLLTAVMAPVPSESQAASVTNRVLHCLEILCFLKMLSIAQRQRASNQQQDGHLASSAAEAACTPYSCKTPCCTFIIKAQNAAAPWVPGIYCLSSATGKGALQCSAQAWSMLDAHHYSWPHANTSAASKQLCIRCPPQ